MNHVDVRLESATPQDAGKLDQIQKRAFLELYESYHDEGNPCKRGKEEILNWLTADFVIYKKILLDGKLCGGLAYFNRGEGEYYLARIFVEPALRGRGIAPKAIKLCEAEFTDMLHCGLDFPEDRTANRRCYEKAGYNDTGIRKQINENLTLAIYEKTIP